MSEESPEGVSVVRKSLLVCFKEARERLQKEARPSADKDSKRSAALRGFLDGINLDQLLGECKDLSEKANDKSSNAFRLWSTLNQFKAVGDAFMDFAPESVSMVWFGISSLIMMGDARFQTKLLICGTCDSIATIIGDCIRWEARMANTDDGAPNLDIWESNVPDLIFNILDFLWNAQPHLDQSKVKRMVSSLKDLFTKELQQKVDRLLEKYQEIVKIAQAHFEDSILHENSRTGTKIDQIRGDLQKFVSIGPEIIDAIQQQALIHELDRQQRKISLSASHNIHFNLLNDRFEVIKKARNNRTVAAWLFEEAHYLDWLSKSNNSTILCLKGPRGHGKSVAMMSLFKTLQGKDSGPKPSLICQFFFKRGEQDIQQSRTALESILYQLLSSNGLRKNTTALVSVIEVLNPQFGEKDPTEYGSDFLDNHTTLCAAIRRIAEAIPERVYLMVDALDECKDRREQNFTQHLVSIAESKTEGLRLVFSSRDSVDIVGEMMQPDAISLLPEIKIIELTPENNKKDMEHYLKYEIENVLGRRINRTLLPDFFISELSKIVSVLHEKAQGDFTLARMIIASLNQPSKDSLERKISRLPAAIGDMYMASLEALSPDEQELVVTALKWVVWSVSAVTVIEISDHYREIYGGHHDDENTTNESLSQLTEIIRQNPYEDPEIKDVLYHLENAGHDFFKVDRNTGNVNVDISIREWIQESDPNVETENSESRGFNRYRDKNGNTVFKFTLTPSFLRYGDSLSDLFNAQEAHMSIAIRALRALNNARFQDIYMPWDSHSPQVDGFGKELQRYEIYHWYDHVRILQDYWSESKLKSHRWSELLKQLSTLSRPENCCRWSLQRYGVEPGCNPFSRAQVLRPAGDISLTEDSYVKGLGNVAKAFEEPLHLACRLGLDIMVDQLLLQALATKLDKKIQKLDISRIGEPEMHSLWYTRAKSLIEHYSTQSKRTRYVREVEQPTLRRSQLQNLFKKLGRSGTAKLLEYLYTSEEFKIEEEKGYGKRIIFVGILIATDPLLRTAWLADKEINSEQNQLADLHTIYHTARVENINEENPLHVPLVDLKNDIAGFLQQCGNDKLQVKNKLEEVLQADMKREEQTGLLLNEPDFSGRLPLYLAAPFPNILKRLIRCGADVNKLSVLCLPSGRLLLTPESPLLSILTDLASNPPDGSKSQKDLAERLLESSRILIFQGADLTIRGECGDTLLHLAAKIRDLSFFKLLCVSGSWDVHAQGANKENAMHCLFHHARPKTQTEINDTLEIFRILIQMRRPDGDDLVNAQDGSSKNPLSKAVYGGFKEAIPLLLELGADIYDDDHTGQTLFHQLSLSGKLATICVDSEVEIAKLLLQTDLDPTKHDQSRKTPLFYALEGHKWHLVDILLDRYAEIGAKKPREHPFFIQSFDGETVFHLAANTSSNSYNPKPKGLFKRMLGYLTNRHDLETAVTLSSYERKNPLHRAIENSDLESVQNILALGFESVLTARDGDGYTPLDKALGMISSFFGEKDEDDLEYLRTMKKIANYILEGPPYSPLSFILQVARASSPTRNPSKDIDWHRVAVAYGENFKDCYGWSIYDTLFAAGRVDIALEFNLPQQTLSPEENFRKPSRIGEIFVGVREVSEDGLRCTKMFPPGPDYKPNLDFFSFDLMMLISDHPVPPTSESFYFEVQLPKIIAPWGEGTFEETTEKGVLRWTPATGRTEDLPREQLVYEYNIECEIGFRAINFGGGGIYYIFQRQDIKKDCRWMPRTTKAKKIIAPAETWSHNEPDWIGCGLNQKENSFFFTVDGKAVAAIKINESWQWFPGITCSYEHEAFEFNFGAKPFVFEKANDPNWKWDHEIHGEALSKGPIT